jgi:hypothetical protein
MACHDADHAATDSYTCTCPSCSDAVFSSSQASELSVFFEGHRSLRRKVATLISRLDDEDGSTVCEVQELSGCTNSSMVGYDPRASVDDGSCVLPVEGCMDASALNYLADASVYTWETHNNTALQCRAANYSEVNECGDGTLATNPCYSANHRLCAHPLGGASAGVPCVAARADAFVCPQNASGGASQSNSSSGSATSGTFSCVDPNPFWGGDYVCTCAYDVLSGGYAAPARLSCGEEVLFQNPYRERSRPENWPHARPTAEQCAERGEQLCGADDAGCVSLHIPCNVTNYQLTQLLKDQSAMQLFLEARGAA